MKLTMLRPSVPEACEDGLLETVSLDSVPLLLHCSLVSHLSSALAPVACYSILSTFIKLVP